MLEELSGMRRTYYIRLYPNKKQQELLDKHFGCARWVYNKMIEINQKKYQRTGKRLSGYDMASYLPKLKKQYPWLKEVNAASLQLVCHNLADGYKRFFKKQNGYPRFKKKTGRESFSCTDRRKLLDKHIKLSKFDLIRYSGGNCPEGKHGTFTISKRAGKYYASILINTGIEIPKPQEPDNILGLDVGLNNFLITSDGFEVPAPKYFRKCQAKLRRAQKTLSRRKKGSNRQKKAALIVAALYQKIANKRKDHAHKLTRILIDGESQAFAIENLNIKGMMSNHALAKSIADVGWHQFLEFLKYKAAAVGKPILEVGKFFPSSQICSECGIVKESLTLSERKWTCVSCGVIHNRDINAAINIALEAARNAARGDGVIPSIRKVTFCEA